MREVDELFVSKASVKLFHYTSISSLLGIAESRTLWASNAYFLNDSAEITHACDVFEWVIDDTISLSIENDRNVEFLRQLKKWIGSFKRGIYNIFVFSLSEQSNLLSQWRGYTPYGKGVSLCFPAGVINGILGKNGFRLAKCVYTEGEKREIINSLLDKLIRSFVNEFFGKEINGGRVDTRYFQFLERFRGEILQVLLIIKSSAFIEEQEWRLISPYYPGIAVPEVKFRAGASILIPYLEISLPDDGHIFDHVLLGPSQYQAHAVAALDMFLLSKGLCSLAGGSGLPYRQW
ncbi:MAG: hypothetical protein K0S46_536 [Moraxellaceae bacterium]|jgi:hypothetical protein|nr:hypothetical protein [Moraxellaceae bacterium]